MMTTSVIDQNSMQADRDMLVRFCARYTGDQHVAEDLAQQSLLRAWQAESSLRDPQARTGWLIAIARNVCLTWGRGHTRETARCQVATKPLPEDHIADGFDFEIELEREELAALLDRALALLPPETREVLIRRYIEESPQAEIAARLGLTEGAVEARLHRGRLGLRRLLATTLSDDAVSLGIIPAAEAGWEETRIWCPACGGRKLEGRFQPERGELRLRCPACAPPGSHYIGAQMGDELRDLHTYRPAISRVLDSIHQLFQVLSVDGSVLCPGCRNWVSVRRERAAIPAFDSASIDTLHLECAHCQWTNFETWHSLAWSLPEGKRFWKANPRMRFVSPRDIEVDGKPAVHTGFESLAGRSHLEAIFLRDSGRVLHVVES
jgi:RNA polymerase sigma factor (sigma-70 family)